MTEPGPQLEFVSFVVRFWHEPASLAWHGKVIHVPSQSACDFVTIEQAAAFMRRFVPALPAGPAPGEGQPD
jgi:hypothetical protein